MFLGIDLGTSEVKALLMDDQGEIVSTAGSKLTVQRPHPLWSEQDPEQWWQATQQAIATLRQQTAGQWQAIRAIGLSGQMHGAVLLDDHDQILRPAILWNDTRCAEQCAALEQTSQVRKITGNIAMLGFTAPKLLWVAENEPAIFQQVKTVLLPKDYLRFRMTGQKVSEMSDAAGTLWLDVARRAWSDEMLAACGLTAEQMPSLVEGSAPSAYLSEDVAQTWALSTDVVVAGGGGDNAASAIGIGAVEPGDAFISLGTSGVLFAVNERFRPNADSAVHTFCHAIPGRWHQMSVMLTAAAALSWLCQLLGTDETTLLAEMTQLPAAELPRAPIFLPYLSGERTPHNDPLAVGAFHGLVHSTDRALLAYSVLEGVAFGVADGLSVLTQAGTHIEQCSVVGGGARSPFWAQLLADTLNLPMVTHHGGEAGGALGAARLGQLATGASVADVCLKPPVAQRFKPDFERWNTLQQRLQHYRLLYRQQLQARTQLNLTS